MMVLYVREVSPCGRYHEMEPVHLDDFRLAVQLVLADADPVAH